MPSQIEKIADSRVNAEEALGLLRRFESTHAPFFRSRWLMGNFGTIIGILGCVVNRTRDKLSMCNAVAP